MKDNKLKQATKRTAILSLSGVLLSLAGQNAMAELNPNLLQEFAQRIANQVIQNDDMIKSAEGHFVIEKTNLEQNIAAFQATATASNLPWAPVSSSRVVTEGSYRAVKKASRYGVEAKAVATAYTPTIAAIRYTAAEFNKELSQPYSTLELDIKPILDQLQQAQNLSQVATLLRQLRVVSNKHLESKITETRRDLDLENNRKAGSGPNQASRCSTIAVEDFHNFERCLENIKYELNSLEMAKIAQDQTIIIETESEDSPSITIEIPELGGSLESLVRYNSNWEPSTVQKFENRKVTLQFTEQSISGKTQAFLGVRKHDFERLEKEFKVTLARFQTQSPSDTRRHVDDVKNIIKGVKELIRNSK